MVAYPFHRKDECVENPISRAFSNNVLTDFLVGAWCSPVHQERLAWSVHREGVVDKRHVVDNLYMKTVLIHLSQANDALSNGELLVGKLSTFQGSISVGTSDRTYFMLELLTVSSSSFSRS